MLGFFPTAGAPIAGSASAVSTTVLETNPHYVTKFQPVKLNKPVLSQDNTGPAVIETNTYFIAKFNAPVPHTLD